MQTENWKEGGNNGGITGTGQLLSTPDDEPQQMPLNMIAGDVPAGDFDASGIDAPRKGPSAGLLLVVVMLAVGGGALWAIRAGGAVAPKNEEVATAEKKIDEALERLASASKDGSALTRDSIDALFNDADQVVALFTNDPLKSQVSVEDLSKNPFELMVVEEADPEEPEKTAVAVDHEKIENRKKLDAEFSGLKLQSLLHGSKSLAVISGKVVRAGDTVGSFTVESIDQAGVKLTAADEAFTLSMTPPITGKQ